MKNEERLQRAADARLRSLVWTEQKENAVLDRLSGEGKQMKKKISYTLILAIALLLAAVGALAATILSRSPDAEAVKTAREALTEKYGLSKEALGLFNVSSQRTEDGYTVHFISNEAVPSSLCGAYTAYLDSEIVNVTWSYDNVDASVYEDGGFDAPVWGKKQLDGYLGEGNEEALAVIQKVYASQPQSSEEETAPEATLSPNLVAVSELQSPKAGDLNETDALDIALHAIQDAYGMERANMRNYELVYSGIYEKWSEKQLRVYYIGVYFVYNGMEHLAGVVMDAKTGVVLQEDITSGGNG